MNKRKIIFFSLLLCVIGLSVILIVAKLTNKIIIAKDNMIISNALKNMEYSYLDDEFSETIDLDVLNNQYTEVNLSSNDKIRINNKIKEDGLIYKVLELREYVDYYYRLRFRNGIFEDSEMVKLASLDASFKDMTEIDINSLNEVSLKLFEKNIDFSNTYYEVLDGKIKKDETNFIKKYILKVNKVYAVNNEINTYDIYIDDIFPKDLEKENIYEKPEVIDYMNSDVVNTYRIRVKRLDDTNYALMGVYCYNYKY